MKRPYNFDNKFFASMEKVAEAITKLRLGFCYGSFGKTLNEKDRAYLFNIGLLYENGKERLCNYVVFPLWGKEQPHINNFL